MADQLAERSDEEALTDSQDKMYHGVQPTDPNVLSYNKIRSVLSSDLGYQACYCMMPWRYFSKEWTVGIVEVSGSVDRPAVVWPASY